MKKMKAALFQEDFTFMPDVLDQVFAQGRMERVKELTDLYPVRITQANFEEHAGQLKDLEVIFSTWSMVRLNGEQVRQMPNLKAVFYAAGATGSFRIPFEENGVIVSSAAAANAIPVAEFALAQVLLAGAGYFRNSRECKDPVSSSQTESYRGHGNYGGRVSILGNGAISTRLQELLAHHDLEITVVPSRMENRTVSLEEAFKTSFAVVNLFPNRDDNAGVLNGDLFRRMIDSAVFINVGRGRQVNEAELVQVMKERSDLTALLDVQYPEPPVEGSELYTIPNIRLSAHIAGSKGKELLRMADYMIEECIRFQNGEPLLYQVKGHQL